MLHSAQSQYTAFRRESKLRTGAFYAAVAALIGIMPVSLHGCGGYRAATEEDVPTGWVDRSILESPAYSQFKIAYDSSHIGQEFVEMISALHHGIDVTVFFGTWCSDSRRDVPRFLKIADLSGMAKEQVRLYALDRTKRSRDGMTERFQIELVPTFIFLKNNQEVGRIVETPKTTLEGDVLTILAGAKRGAQTIDEKRGSTQVHPD
jgi:thiol-disulfide isomerase/thioredoxin